MDTFMSSAKLLVCHNSDSLLGDPRHDISAIMEC